MHAFCYILIFKAFSSDFVVLGDDFLKRFTVSFMELLIGYSKTFPLEIGGGGQMDKTTYTIGGLSKHKCVSKGGSVGLNFRHFGTYVLTE